MDSSPDSVGIDVPESVLVEGTNLYTSPGSNDDEATALAVDRDNNVIVTGYSTGSGTRHDYLTIKYSSDGVPLWTNRYDGPGNRDDEPNVVAVDRNGYVYVTGPSASLNSASYSCLAWATVAYSGAGVPLWTNCFGAPDNGNWSASPARSPSTRR